MSVIYDLDQLAARLDYWTERLRLQDWDFQVQIVRDRDMSLANTQADIQIIPTKKTARISVLDPLDYEPSCWNEQDMEVSLVHELLHIHFDGIGPRENSEDDPRLLQEEIAVNTLSHALVTLDRELTAIKEANNG